MYALVYSYVEFQASSHSFCLHLHVCRCERKLMGPASTSIWQNLVDYWPLLGCFSGLLKQSPEQTTFLTCSIETSTITWSTFLCTIPGSLWRHTKAERGTNGRNLDLWWIFSSGGYRLKIVCILCWLEGLVSLNVSISNGCLCYASCSVR